jgi:cell division transport system ATP-binding protein
MINFQNITKIYQTRSETGQIVALNDISFTVEKGEFISIVGRSGAGKTTLLKMLLAEERPTGGHIFFEDQDVNLISSKDLPLFRRRLGSVFQDYKLIPSKKASENVAYALEVIGATEEEIRRDVPQVLELVGLDERGCNFRRNCPAVKNKGWPSPGL